MNTVSLDLGSRSYEIFVAPGLLEEAGQRIQSLGLKGRAAIITDSHFTDGSLPHLAELESSLANAGIDFSTHQVPAGEASKSLSKVADLCSSLAESKHDRSSFVIALGGGVVGDLAGFVAATFYRGIPFVQIPTTIVAQVDSAVGGKTGVNIPEGKNLVGAFHQPRLVLTDPKTLTTLGSREFKEGFAEVIKHAAIRDADMLADLEQLDPANQNVPADLIARNVAIKARIVEEDEKETAGTRALLNFGHTIGHGIEAAVPYGSLLHGEAISLGMRAALDLSVKHAGLSLEGRNRILNLLEHFDLPLKLDPGIKTEVILEKLARDKKFSGGNRVFVLLTDPGHAITCDSIPSDDVINAIESLRS